MKIQKLNLLIFSCAFLFVVPTVFAQKSEKEQKQQAKEAKKKQKAEKAAAEWNDSKQMAEKKQFVFKANQLFTKDGTFSLDPKINFFYVIDDYAVIQFGFDGVFIGGNGLGGITSEGTVATYKVIADNQKKPVQVELSVKPKAGQGIGIGNFAVKFYGDGYGEVLLYTNGYRLKGKIEKPENANIYQGNKL